MKSPQQYISALVPEKITDERPPSAIMLSHLKRGTDRNYAIMVIAMQIKEVNDFFNVKGNMNSNQIALTAELILDNDGFYDLTLGNIKACFRKMMMSGKVYDRVDGNIIINWLREFKSQMGDHIEISSLGKNRQNINNSIDAISHNVYMAMVEAKANDGDEESQRILNDYKRRSSIPNPEELRKKDLEFFKYKQEYLKRKRNGESII